MVEIGPGHRDAHRGARALVAPLHVVEIDRDWPRASRALPAAQVIVHHADALAFDFAQLPRRCAWSGNLPLTSPRPSCFACAAHRSPARLRLHAAERSVDRMVASRDVRLRTPLGDAAVPPLRWRSRCACRRRLYPPPKVGLRRVRMKPLGEDRARARDEERFAAIVAAAFSQRRKTLRNAARALITEEGSRRRASIRAAAGETLGVAEFIALADTRAPFRALNEFDLVAVRILDERDERCRRTSSGRPRASLAAPRAHRIAGLVRVRARHGDVARSRAQIVGLRIPVVRELDHRVLALVAEAHECERVNLPSDNPCAAAASCPARRCRSRWNVEVADADHGVQQAMVPPQKRAIQVVGREDRFAQSPVAGACRSTSAQNAASDSCGAGARARGRSHSR